MKKPAKPIPSDCCGQGCTPCVYEQYAHRMEIYEEWLEEKETENGAKSNSENIGAKLSKTSD